MPTQSMMFKIAILGLFIILASGIISIMIVHKAITNSYSEGLDDVLSSNALDISAELSSALENGNLTDAHLIIERRLQNNDDIEYIFITNVNGNVLLTVPSDFHEQQKVLNSNEVSGNNAYEIDEVSLSSGDMRDVGAKIDSDQVGVVHMGIGTDSISESASSAIMPFIAGFIILFLIAAVAIMYSFRVVDDTTANTDTGGQATTGILRTGHVKIGPGPDPAIYQEELESTKLALQASESKYKSLINNLRSAILTIDKSGLILTVNKSGVKLLGCQSMEDAKKSNLFRDFGIPKEDCKSFIKMLREKGFVENFETIIIKMDGEKAIVRITSQIIRDKKDRIVRIDSIIRDITTQKMAEREKSQLEAELFHAEKLASIGQLAAGVAHEINNPLTNISLLTTSIQRKTDDPVISEKLEKLHQQRKIAAKIVADLLHFSRKMDPKFIKMNLAKTISEAIVQTPANDNNLITLKNNTEGEEIWVRGDPDLLRQVFINIIQNAYDAMDESGKLTITSRSIGIDHIEIEVADSGPGIPDNILPKIFDPFYSTKQTDMGTGLGLSICHGIIKSHEGKIYARNREPQGASFLIQLPRWKDEVQDIDSG